MVDPEKNSQKYLAGDGVVRNIIYAKWRTDKPAEPGHSHELVNINLEPKYYDN